MTVAFNRWAPMFVLWLCFLAPCNFATFSTSDLISRYSGNILKNILGEQRFKHNIVTSSLDGSNFWVGFYRVFRDIVRGISGDTGYKTRGTFLQRPLLPSASFPCRRYNQRSPTVPDSVHNLRPGDIDVIAAMGDSVTAGTGANAETVVEVAVENRGLSFSIGGQKNFRTHLTLPNILKEFNPRLFGYALGDAYSKDRMAQFNLAENIATTSDMPFMAYKLLRRMRLDRRVNMKKQWKLVTIMIGGNDFCSDICHQKGGPIWTNNAIEINIIKTLRIIRDNMPRTFVNLVTEPLVSLILSMNVIIDELPLPCQLIREIGCTCLTGPYFTENRDVNIRLEKYYRTIFDRVAHRDEFQRKDFAVVHQPFGVNATIRLNDRILNPGIMAYDCIHFSQLGHAVAANALWNNMMQPESQKHNGFKPLFEEFQCPTDDNPYLKTYLNSK